MTEEQKAMRRETSRLLYDWLAALESGSASLQWVVAMIDRREAEVVPLGGGTASFFDAARKLAARVDAVVKEHSA